MVDYPDQPDYQQAVTPGVTRWAPGTEFGNVAWSGAVAANTPQLIYYPVPNNGYTYVLDKVFIDANIYGVYISSVSFCQDYGTPVWVALAVKTGEHNYEFAPFSFVSIALRYPQALMWYIMNPNNVSRTIYLYATMYRYLSSA